MVWQILQDNTRVIKQYSTPICKIWFVITFVFRLMIVTTVGSQVYGDEQGSFKEITVFSRRSLSLSLYIASRQNGKIGKPNYHSDRNFVWERDV